MTEIKIEVGDNLKECILELIKVQSVTEARISFQLQEAFGIDFGKILKGFGKKISIIEDKRLGPAPTGRQRI